MTNKEAIKYLQQLYPNGGHCWLDEQRIEAIGMAVKALQEEPVSEELENAAVEWFNSIKYRSDISGSPINAFMTGAKWQEKQDKETIELAEDHAMLAGMEKMKEQMMAEAIDVEVKVDAGDYPYIPQMELYDYDKDVPLAKEGDKYKVILIKDE